MAMVESSIGDITRCRWCTMSIYGVCGDTTGVYESIYGIYGAIRVYMSICDMYTVHCTLAQCAVCTMNICICMYMVHYEYMGSRRGFADTRTDVGTQSAPSTPEYSNKQTRDLDPAIQSEKETNEF